MDTPRLHDHHSACEEVPEKISAQKSLLRVICGNYDYVYHDMMNI
jgi:hypothetical protein